MIFEVNASLDLGLLRQRYGNALARGGMIQKFIDTTIINDVEPYVPMKKGTLTKSGLIHSRVGYGSIVWKTPYARYLWYGKSKNGKDLKFNKSRHPLAGKLWAERYKADHLDELKSMVVRKLGEV